MAEVADDTAREVLRSSKDRSGRERSNERQQGDNHTVWSNLRFVGRPYREVGSASPFAKRERDEFPQLLADLASGRFGARHLVMWEGSRGSRQVEEWLRLINSCEAAGVRIAITDHERVYDPTRARDRKELIDIANDAEFESRQLSARVRSDAATVAAKGTPIGPAPYGYRRVYDPTTRAFLRLEPDPVEAPVMRTVFAMLEQGHSARAVAAHLTEQGVVTRRGREMSPAQLVRWAKSVAYIGQRSHLPVDNWRTMTPAERLAAQTTVDAWEPLVDERQFWAVQRIVRNPARATSSRPFRATHPYSFAIRCGNCGGPAGVVKYRSPEGHYFCQPKGCVMVFKPPVDEIVDEAVVGYLSRPDTVARTLSADVDDATVDEARAEVERIRRERDDLYDAVGQGQVTVMMQARAEPQILARLAEAERRVAELTTPSELRGLIAPGEDVAARWAVLPVPAKRRVAKLLLTPEVLGEVRLLPLRKGPGKMSVPVEDRIMWWLRCPDCEFEGPLDEVEAHTC
jgi:DNA invertase Pin-like site-specific DNA recombinase